MQTLFVDVGVRFFRACAELATKAVITIAKRLYDTIRYDYDPTTTYRAPASIRHDSTRAKMNMSIFRRSRVVVVSQSNRNCDIGLTANVCESVSKFTRRGLKLLIRVCADH